MNQVVISVFKYRGWKFLFPSSKQPNIACFGKTGISNDFANSNSVEWPHKHIGTSQPFYRCWLVTSYYHIYANTLSLCISLYTMYVVNKSLNMAVATWIMYISCNNHHAYKINPQDNSGVCFTSHSFVLLTFLHCQSCDLYASVLHQDGDNRMIAPMSVK